MAVAIAGFVDAGFTHVAFGDCSWKTCALPRGPSGGIRPRAALPALEDEDNRRTRARDDRRRPRGATDVRGPTTASSGRLPDARSTRRLLEALPQGVDPCGENGEFHTFACAGPMFRHPNRCPGRRGGRP